MKIDKNEIIRLLNEKKALLPCHRCGTENFTVMNSFSKVILQDDINSGTDMEGASVPVAIIACRNCGAITFHALGALGVLQG